MERVIGADALVTSCTPHADACKGANAFGITH
jgi:hypothetical protein